MLTIFRGRSTVFKGISHPGSVLLAGRAELGRHILRGKFTRVQSFSSAANVYRQKEESHHEFRNIKVNHVHLSPSVVSSQQATTYTLLTVQSPSSPLDPSGWRWSTSCQVPGVDLGQNLKATSTRLEVSSRHQFGMSKCQRKVFSNKVWTPRYTKGNGSCETKSGSLD